MATVCTAKSATAKASNAAARKRGWGACSKCVVFVLVPLLAVIYPALLAVGLGAQRVFGPLRQRLPLLSAALVLVMGLLSISGRFSMQHMGVMP
jgi:hypothetical protein